MISRLISDFQTWFLDLISDFWTWFLISPGVAYEISRSVGPLELDSLVSGVLDVSTHKGYLPEECGGRWMPKPMTNGMCVYLWLVSCPECPDSGRGVSHWRNRRQYSEYGHYIPYSYIFQTIFQIFSIPILIYSVFRSYSCIFLAISPYPLYSWLFLYIPGYSWWSKLLI